MIDFNQTKTSYRESIEQSIRFSGKNHDFFLKRKALLIKKFLASLKVESPKILDIGCGHGLIHRFLQDQALTGVDPAAEVIEMARESNPQVAYVCNDGRTLPFASQSFDAALCLCVLHHVPKNEWIPFLREMKRVIRPGGLGIIFEHNPYNPLTRYVVRRCPLDEGVTLATRSRLQQALQQAGFTSFYSRYLFLTPFDHPLFLRLDNSFGKIPLGAQYFTVCS